MSKNWQAAAYAVLNALLVGFAMQLEKGEVPLPKELAWVVPLIVLAITAMSPYVKIGAKPPEE